MSARLILNADDFGLTRGVNRAIAELHAAGVLTSATLMATGAAFDDAISIAHAYPTLGVGCHIVLTDGIPVSPPHTIPTLCPNGRTFRPNLTDFIRDVLFGHIGLDDIESEAAAQIRRIQEAGIFPTHLDTHKHTHIFPKVVRALRNAGLRTKIRAIRNPFEPRYTRTHTLLKRRVQIAALNLFQSSYQRATAGVLTTDGTFGIAATGNLGRTVLAEMLRSLPAEGTFELLCHPGYHDADLDTIPTRLRAHRDLERQALLSEVPPIFLLPNGPKLINYSDI
jgi:predicted glycoside hydrolase/deacetylase ChbG (UPF0249 family)